MGDSRADATAADPPVNPPLDAEGEASMAVYALPRPNPKASSSPLVGELEADRLKDSTYVLTRLRVHLPVGKRPPRLWVPALNEYVEIPWIARVEGVLGTPRAWVAPYGAGLSLERLPYVCDVRFGIAKLADGAMPWIWAPRDGDPLGPQLRVEGARLTVQRPAHAREPTERRCPWWACVGVRLDAETLRSPTTTRLVRSSVLGPTHDFKTPLDLKETLHNNTTVLDLVLVAADEGTPPTVTMASGDHGTLVPVVPVCGGRAYMLKEPLVVSWMFTWAARRTLRLEGAVAAVLHESHFVDALQHFFNGGAPRARILTSWPSPPLTNTMDLEGAPEASPWTRAPIWSADAAGHIVTTTWSALQASAPLRHLVSAQWHMGRFPHEALADPKTARDYHELQLELQAARPIPRHMVLQRDSSTVGSLSHCGTPLDCVTQVVVHVAESPDAEDAAPLVLFLGNKALPVEWRRTTVLECALPGLNVATYELEVPMTLATMCSPFAACRVSLDHTKVRGPIAWRPRLLGGTLQGYDLSLADKKRLVLREAPPKILSFVYGARRAFSHGDPSAGGTSFSFDEALEVFVPPHVDDGPLLTP